MKKETKAQFLARNAADGRTVVFNFDVDMNAVSDADREKYKLVGKIKIQRGTLTPETTRKILDLVFAPKVAT